MQAVILAAGKSTRTYPLTLTRPKPLLKVANKTLLEISLDNLSGIVEEAIIVVGYKKEMITKKFGNEYKSIKLKYAEQKQQRGTGNAVLAAEPFIKNKFILLMGDDIYQKSDIKKCSKFDYSILVSKVENPENFGVVLEKKGILIDFFEKPKSFVSNLANTALYVLDSRIFQKLKQLKKTERNEFELPDAIKMISRTHEIHCVKTTNWAPVAYPWDLLKTDRKLRRKESIVGRNSKIFGTVSNSTIGDDCLIKGIVKDSIIMDGAVVDEGSIVENSVIGNNAYFKGKIFARNVYSLVKGKKINAGKIGAIIGDNCMLENVRINPGCKTNPGTKIKNQRIEHDVE